jgi:hypothetical protein
LHVISVSIPLAAKKAELPEAMAVSISAANARNCPKSADGLPDIRVGSGVGEALRDTCGVGEADRSVAVAEAVDCSASSSSEQPKKIKPAKDIAAINRYGV